MRILAFALLSAVLSTASAADCPPPTTSTRWSSRWSMDRLSQVWSRRADGTASAIVMHQVLHFLSDPQRALREAARVLVAGGRLMIVDFAPHALEELRERFAHERLGFATAQIEDWLEAAGLRPGEVRTLSPPASEATDHLTVSIWTAEKPAEVAHARKTAPAERKLERT